MNFIIATHFEVCMHAYTFEHKCEDCPFAASPPRKWCDDCCDSKYTYHYLYILFQCDIAYQPWLLSTSVVDGLQDALRKMFVSASCLSCDSNHRCWYRRGHSYRQWSLFSNNWHQQDFCPENINLALLELQALHLMAIAEPQIIK